MKKKFNHSIGRSQTATARLLGCSRRTVGRILKQRKKPIVSRKRIKRPARTRWQQIQGRIKCGRLYRKYNGHFFILDDESYFTLTHSRLTNNDRYYSDSISETPEHLKYVDKTKFEKKLLVWLAMSSKGVSSILIRPSGNAINQHVYLNECIQKRLVPFIKKHHIGTKYVFWPDLASSHYARSVVDWLQSNNISFVPKESNPANVPEVRPIEDFWGILKANVYKGGWQANNLQQLESRIRTCLKNIDIALVQRPIGGTIRRIDRVRRNGVV